MTRNKMLILLDSRARVDATSEEVARIAGFSQRLAQLEAPLVAWGSSSDHAPTVDSRESLLQKCQGVGAETLVLVGPDQWFLDPRLVQRGLWQFEPERHDYFTQWEHCRLPVGVGVRAVSVRSFRQSDARSPFDFLQEILDHPPSFKFCYDVEHRVEFADSLLDARDHAGLRRALATGARPESWDLSGFLNFAKCQGEDWRYRPSPVAPRRDERGMPAAYGFESAACAEFPTYVMFDVTNVCNARCVHCPQSLTTAEGKRPEFLADTDHLTLQAFQRVVDECQGRELQFVRITADGEPLVHPHLFSMLEYAKEKGVGPAGLTTNGSLLNEQRAERLAHSGVAIVDFSLDAIRPETFRRIRVGLNFARTQENVLRFLKIRDQERLPIKVMVSFVKQADNVDEVEEFRDFWAPRVDKVLIREMISNVGLNDPSESLWPGWDKRWPCAHLFRRVVVNHRGVLKYCPIDWEQRTTHRSVLESSLQDQWHSDFYWRSRMQHLNDRFASGCACEECPDWAGTPWDLGYEKVVAQLAGSSAAS